MAHYTKQGSNHYHFNRVVVLISAIDIVMSMWSVAMSTNEWNGIKNINQKYQSSSTRYVRESIESNSTGMSYEMNIRTREASVESRITFICTCVWYCSRFLILAYIVSHNLSYLFRTLVCLSNRVERISANTQSSFASLIFDIFLLPLVAPRRQWLPLGLRNL